MHVYIQQTDVSYIEGERGTVCTLKPLIASARIHSDSRGRGIGRSWSGNVGGNGATRFDWCEVNSDRDSVRDCLKGSTNLEPKEVRFDPWEEAFGCTRSGMIAGVGSVIVVFENGLSIPRRTFFACAHGALLAILDGFSPCSLAWSSRSSSW